MEFVHYRTDGAVGIISLGRAKANALNAALVAELGRSVEMAATDASVRAVVLGSSIPKFFSAGFDAKEAFQYERGPMQAFLFAYGELLHRIRTLPKATVAAVSGHAYAGGAILALACDFRVFAEGEFGFALNEVNVGVVLPHAVFRLLADVVGEARARQMVMTGDPVGPRRAMEIGLTDELAAPDQVLERAVALAAKMAAKPPQTLAEIKAETLKGSPDGAALAPPLEPWFTPEAEERKRAVLEGLKK